MPTPAQHLSVGDTTFFLEESPAPLEEKGLRARAMCWGESDDVELESLNFTPHVMLPSHEKEDIPHSQTPVTSSGWAQPGVRALTPGVCQ